MGTRAYKGYNGSNGKGSLRAMPLWAPLWGKSTKAEARRALQAGVSPEVVAAQYGVSVRRVRRLL